MTAMVVAAAAVDPLLGDVETNLDRCRAAVDRAVAAGARVIVLPELATSGYVFASAAEARAAAIRPDDHRLADLGRSLPREAVLVVGFAELGAGDLVHNAAATITADGVLDVYRKTHLWGSEPRFFTPGDRAPRVLQTPAGRIGVGVCYDVEFPEVPRGLALAGAELIAAPVNWPLSDRRDGERPPETVLAQAAARASRVVMIISDRYGAERGVDWTGGSCIIDHDGWVLADARDTPALPVPPGPLPCPGDQLVIAEVDLAATHDKSLGPYNDSFADRRPDLY